jgi:hypothetical protein
MNWNAIQYVTGGFTLIAFLVATLSWLYKARTEERENLIKTAAEGERATLVRLALEFFEVATADLTKQQQYDIAIAQIRAKVERIRITAIVVCILASLLAGLTVYAIAANRSVTPEHADSLSATAMPTATVLPLLLPRPPVPTPTSQAPSPTAAPQPRPQPTASTWTPSGTPKPRKVSTQIYMLIGGPVAVPANAKGPVPVDIRETMRGDVELIPGETYWIPPPDQRVASARPCGSDPSAGWACVLDSSDRLRAYFRNSCSDPPAEGPKVSRGCSRAAPLFGAPGQGLMVQCCFFEDSPAAKGLPFNHSFGEWFGVEMGRKR